MSEKQVNKRARQKNPSVTLGGGCFWCLEAVYMELQGVTEIVSGYSGGEVADPSYQQVCSGNTGHAEVVQVTFDPEQITYEEILSVFFATHDPTTLNKQGADVGTQYRSVIFYQNGEQKEAAEKLIADLDSQQIWSNPIVTEVAPLEVFYEAEDYHQEYYRYNSAQPYCQVVITPKVATFRSSFADKLKSSTS